MGVDASVSCCTRQILIFSVRNMQMRPWITIFLGETEINNIDLIAAFSNTH